MTDKNNNRNSLFRKQPNDNNGNQNKANRERKLADLIRNIKLKNLETALLQGRFDSYTLEDLETQSSHWILITINPDNLQNMLIAGLWAAFTTKAGEAAVLTLGLLWGYPLQFIFFSCLVLLSFLSLGDLIYKRITKGKNSGVTNLDLLVSGSGCIATAASVAIGFLLVLGIGVALSFMSPLSSALFAIVGVICACYFGYIWLKSSAAKKNSNNLEKIEAANFGKTRAIKLMVVKGIVGAVLSTLVFGLSVAGPLLLVASVVGCLAACVSVGYYIYKKNHEKRKIKKIRQYLAAKKLLEDNKKQESKEEEKLFNLATNNKTDFRTFFALAIRESYKESQQPDHETIEKIINTIDRNEESKQKIESILIETKNTPNQGSLVLRAVSLFSNHCDSCSPDSSKQLSRVADFLREYRAIGLLLDKLPADRNSLINSFNEDQNTNTAIIKEEKVDYNLLFSVAKAKGKLLQTVMWTLLARIEKVKRTQVTLPKTVGLEEEILENIELIFKAENPIEGKKKLEDFFKNKNNSPLFKDEVGKKLRKAIFAFKLNTFKKNKNLKKRSAGNKLAKPPQLGCTKQSTPLDPIIEVIGVRL